MLTRKEDHVCGWGKRGSPLQERGPSADCAARSGTPAAAANSGALERRGLGGRAPRPAAPPPAGSSGQGVVRAATDPGRPCSLAPRGPDGGKRAARAGRCRAGHVSARRRAPPRGGRGEAALPLPSPALAPAPSFSSSQERRPGAGSEQSQLPLQSPFFPSARLARASLARKAVNVWSHSSPFSLAALPVSRSKPDQ